MSRGPDTLAIALFSEIMMADQLAREKLGKRLPKGMELSQFSVLNHLAHADVERSPGQIASAFHLTRGAMTNTLRRLETQGWVHIRPDWEDARRKIVSISPAGRAARESGLQAIAPLLDDVVAALGGEHVRQTLPMLRALRQTLAEDREE